MILRVFKKIENENTIANLSQLTELFQTSSSFQLINMFRDCLNWCARRARHLLAYVVLVHEKFPTLAISFALLIVFIKNS